MESRLWVLSFARSVRQTQSAARLAGGGPPLARLTCAGSLIGRPPDGLNNCCSDSDGLFSRAR